MDFIHVGDLLGVPYVEGGRDPKVGLDCWGLVMEVCRRNGVVLPDVLINATQKDAAEMQAGGVPNDWIQRTFSGWRRSDSTKVGCVVAYSNCEGAAVHVGVVVEPGKFIHTMKRVGQPTIHRLDREPWPNRFVGAYEHTG